MSVQLGQKIRTLRKQKNMSQETLANHLGVTFQAVSKWENDIAMPDVALIPAIAAFFEVSTDELFDYNLYEIEQKVEAIVTEHCRYRDSDSAQAEQILRNGLEQYPGNDTLLNCLIYMLPLPEKSGEVISLCKQLIDSTKHDDIKYDACRILAGAYLSIGAFEMAKGIIDQIPEIHFTKLTVMAWLLNGAEKMAAADKQKWISFEELLQMMGKRAECFEEDGKYDEALAEVERAQKLIDAMADDPIVERFGRYAEAIDEQKERLRILITT